MKRLLFPPEAFGRATDYKLLPFRFLALDDSHELLVNEVGEFMVAQSGTARRVIRRELDIDSDLYRQLRARQFLYDDASSPLLDILATKYRTKKSFLDGFTQLHIFVVTLRCEHSCPYCQVSRQCEDRQQFDMTAQDAEGFLDLMFRSPARALTLEFQGGEPLLNFERIKQVVEGAEARADASGRDLRKVIATNLALLSEPVLEYCKAHNIHLSTSLDGPEFLHNANRPRPGNDSHQRVLKNLAWAREYLGYNQVAALMTTTRRSLDFPREIVDEYVRHGFRSIFLRRLSPYGFAVKTEKSIGYDTERFLEFYFTALDYILELNRQGVYIEESYAKLLLTKILTPFPIGYVDLQSPAGAGIGVVVYNYDGAVYATDESRMLAEMKDPTFLLGNVRENSYEELFAGPKLQHLVRQSCVESLPGCSDCALQVYCGADPVFHYATQGDLVGHRPTSAFCRTNMAIMKHLFQLLARDDRELNRILLAWVREVSHQEMREEVPA